MNFTTGQTVWRLNASWWDSVPEIVKAKIEDIEESEFTGFETIYLIDDIRVDSDEVFGTREEAVVALQERIETRIRDYEVTLWDHQLALGRKLGVTQLTKIRNELAKRLTEIDAFLNV